MLNEPLDVWELRGLPDGRAGVAETLRLMRAVTRKYKASQRVRLLAMQLCKPLHGTQKNYVEQVRRLFHFVQNDIGYLRDIRGVETIQTPDVTLQLGAGDCDDKSTLLASLLESCGHPTRFFAMGFFPGRFSHVIVQTRIGTKWVSLDATEPHPMGWQPPMIMESMIVHN